MRVWLDDLRPMPVGYDVWVKSAPEAIHLLATGKVTFISLDHDLGVEHYMMKDSPGSGYDVALFIEQAVWRNLIPMPEWRCHSMNPVGRERIILAMRRAEVWSLMPTGRET